MSKKLIKNNLGFIPPNDWRIEKIGDFAEIKVGRDLKEDRFNESNTNDFKYPVYSNTVEKMGLYGFYKKPEYSEKCVTVVGRGAGVGTAFKRDEPFGAIGRLLVLIPNGKVNSNYLKLFINDRVRFYNESTGVPQLTGVQVKSYLIAYPPKDEQEKIEKIISTWDETISKTVKLIKAKKRYKKGLMKRLLSGEVRFHEFEGEDWVEKRLGKLVKQAKRKVPKPDDEYLSIGIRSHGKGTFQKPDKDPQDNSMTSLYKVKENDLIVNITFAWEGAIAIVKKEDENGYVSHRFPTYEFDTEKLIPEYFQYVIVQPWFVYKLGLISPGGAGRNRVLNKKDFLKLKVEVPSISEQNKIAEVLTTVDDEIDLLETQLECYQKQKKGLMQKLLTGKVRVKSK